MTVRRVAAAAVMVGVTAAVSAQSIKFTPPRLLKAELPGLPAHTVVGGGEVLIEATVDRTGGLIRPIIVRGTPPYTQMVLDAMAKWRFEPAKATGPEGRETAVDAQVAIAAAYRPPILMNAPTLGEAPKDWSKPSGDVAYPLSMEMPNYPPQARDSGTVLLEVALTEPGTISGMRVIASIGGFEGAALEALAKWRFRGGSYRAQPVPAKAYVVFGFQSPVVSSPQFPPPTR